MDSRVFVGLFCIFISTQQNYGESKIVTFAREGDACNRNDNEWYAIPESDSHFLYCHPKHGLYVKGQCGLANDGRRMIFDVAAQQCIAPLNSTSTAEWLQKKSNTWPEFHLISRKNLGDQCTSNAECPNSSFCDHFGTCVCLPDFVLVQASCWKKAEPTEACTHNEQCEAAWPHSVCINGICNCPNNTRMVKSFVGRLCLSPAYICIQPASSQNGIFDFNQYFYNSLTDECEPIMFKGGGMANSNIFKTRRECENFCKSGEPETKLGRPVKCRSNADCSSPYDCYHRSGDQTYGICCPSKAFVCSPFGGVFMDIALLDEPLIEYDEGLQARSTQSLNFPVIRYYFSIQELKCKAFLYRGIGGNFNNFLSFEQCFDHCMPVVCGGGKTALDRAGRLIRCVNDRDCPAHHSCHAGICCQRKEMAVDKEKEEQEQEVHYCSENSTVVLIGGKVAECNFYKPCMNNTVCQVKDAKKGSGICCQEYVKMPRARKIVSHFAEMLCPMNSSSLVVSAKKKPLQCNLDSMFACPTNFTCSFPDKSATSGLCCLIPNSGLMCPGDLKPPVEKSNVKSCSPLKDSSCDQSNEICYFNQIYGNYYCCPNVFSGCPPHAPNAVHYENGTAMKCNNVGDQFTCPENSFCHQSPFATTGVCCSEQETCPDGRKALTDDNGSLIECSQTCPIGHICIPRSGNKGKNICCQENFSIWQCDHGRALINPKGELIKCSSINSCPDGYTCTDKRGEKFCCPSAGYFCNQPVNPGKSCTGGKVSKKFYFDPVERICKAFNYFGCNGNDNRFNTIGECESWCDLSAVCSHGLPIRESRETRNCSAEKSCPSGYKCVSVTNGENFCCPDRSKLKENIQFHFNYCDTVKDLVCNMPLNPGFSCSSVEQSEMFFYHFSSKACLKFKYEGCGGNLNRFHTLQSCQSFCLSMLCPVGNPLSTNGEVKHCKTDHECPSEYSCVLETGVCCLKSKIVCSKSEQQGETCGLPQFRFRYDIKSNSCKQFTFAGCAGNENNFYNKQACEQFCKSELLCPAGSTAFINSATSQPLQCAENAEICPPGFKCYNNIQNGKSICCSALTKCLSGLEPYKVKENIRPLKCIPGRFGFFDGCPNKYECQETTNGEFHCCPEANVTNACPEQVKVHVHKERSQPTKCYAADPSCPNGYVCRLNHMFGHRFCCAEPKRDSSMLTAEVSLCPDRSKPYIDPTTKLTAVCNPYLHFTCPTSYSCTFIQSASNYHCCISNQLQPYTAEEQSRETPACPGGLQPFINRANGQPVICQPPLLGICPAGSICQYSSLYWQFICCASDIYSKNFHDEIKVILPGDTGCQNDRQCSNGFPGSFCHQGICKCPPSMFIYQRSCVPSCPNGYNTNNGVCENAK
ncbi:Uncharacterized protein T4D_14584 [Trichinella pseudospiralis]|uniref:BPTI/Kunitz inhibitor domain-containing protein n=1 Tax=Trichinella pseudospiralis TaxID=6337 RepID=A0A0V1FHQ3_TRIPS|nr:Uncharacterized protein T4D_14584 [Trichinella pseudospiralis]